MAFDDVQSSLRGVLRNRSNAYNEGLQYRGSFVLGFVPKLFFRVDLAVSTEPVSWLARSRLGSHNWHGKLV